MKRHWNIILAPSALLVFLGVMVIGCVQPMNPKPTSDNQALIEVQTTPTQINPSRTTNDKSTFTPTAQHTTPTFTPTIGQLAFTSTTITPAIPSIIQAYADGDRLFFIAQDWKSIDPPQMNSVSIYLQNLATGETTFLSSSPYGGDGRICCLRPSENWLTWLTNKSNGSGWLLVAKRLPDGQEIILDRDVDTGVSTLRGPFTALSGDQFVWVSPRKLSDGSVKTYLVLANLSTGERRTLAEATMPESLVYVNIDEQWVVWSKGSSAGGVLKSNVYLYNLVSGKLTQLSEDDKSHQPVIKDNWIAWRTGFGDTGPIVVYNRRTGEHTTLPIKGDFLRMGDGLLMWWTYSNPFTYVYDLNNHTIDDPENKNHQFDSPIFISGRKVAMVSSSPDPKTLKTGIEIRTYLP